MSASANIAGVQITVWPNAQHPDRWNFSFCKNSAVEHGDVYATDTDSALAAAGRLLGLEIAA